VVGRQLDQGRARGRTQANRDPLSSGRGSQLGQMAGLTGRLSKHDSVWEHIRALHMRRSRR
jgi:hypothetical protein